MRKDQRLEAVIIDEFTGRPGEGRRWQDGIHEAIEAKEKLEIQFSEGQAAKVTVQDFFGRYPLLCGMSGTAAPSRGEVPPESISSTSSRFRRTGRAVELLCCACSARPKRNGGPWSKRSAPHAIGRPVLIGMCL